MRGSLAFFLLAWFGLVTSNEEGEEEVHFTNSWAVHFDNEDLHAVNDIAQKHGFVNQGQIGSLPGYYHFVKNTVGERSRRSLEDHSETLLKEPKVKWVEQQRILERSKRDVIPGEDELVQRSVARLRRDTAVTIRDPFFKDQWYLQNIGQSSGPRGIDINVLPVWARGFSGRGVVVSVLDDGVDHTHPDLEPNYDPDASFDFNEFDGDPKPRDDNLANCHGTKCAGEVAARANNGICGVGVSFNASIGGIRMLDGKATDTVEGSSLSYRSDYIDIYSCCWGPKDDGKRFGKPGYLASKALQIGAERGRGGLGNIYVWATGNGGLTDDDCNCDGYTTSIYTISIGAISDHGLSTYYTETCASTLGVTFSGGSHRESEENKVVTTDLHHKCTGVFKGTSSAAPLAAGMMALLLESNPRLSWRDVQHIIVESSHVTSPLDEGWKINGAGKRYNHKFGFGRLDASRMVEKALKWKNVDRQKTCPGAEHNTTRLIPASGSLILSANTSACASTSSEIRKLEHVQLKVSLQHRHRGDLSISLISPSGTRSELLTTRRNDHSAMGLKDWVFMTVHCWGEDPRGLWTVIITDNDNNNRKHYADKAKQGDAEDVTRIFMDDTGKHRPVQTGDKDDSKMSPNGGLMQDHVMKTMEDTAGNLFKGNGFTKFVHRKKMHLVDTPSVPVTKKKPVLKKPVKSSVNHIVKDSKVTPLHKEYRKSGKDKKHKKLSKSHKLTSFSKQSSKRLAKKKDHKHADIVKLQHKRKAAKKRLTSGNITPKKIANPKHKKHKDPSKKAAKTKLKFHKTLKPNFNSSNISPVQPLKTSLHKPTVAGNVSTSSNATALGLITKLLSEIQKNPLVTKIAMEALKDPAIGRLFGVKPFGAVPEKALGALVSSSSRGNNSDSKSHLENNSSLVNTSNQTEKPEESKYLEGNIINGSKVERAFEGQHVGELESSGQPENQFHGSIGKISGSGKDDLSNKALDVSGSGAEESGSYWETGSVHVQMHSDESGSAESGETDSVENTREMGCAKAQCNETQTGGGISVIIQGTPANESSNEFGGEDSFVEVSDEDDRESLYGDGEGEEFFENVKKVVESEDGPVVLEPAVDRSRINSGNKNEDSLNLCDLMGGPQNRSAMARKYCKENGTLNSNTDGNDYENEQLAHYLALGKFKGSPTGSSEDEGMEHHGEKSENEPYYSDKSDETRDTHDQMVAKYSSRDLEVLQEALEDQLSRLSKDPASQKSNAEILARVRDDINHGDIEDLELLEAQITGGKSTVPRVIRSTAPEDEDLDDLDDSSDAISDAMPDAFEHIDQTFEHNDQTFEHIDQEDDELERRRVEHRSEKHKLSQMYFVDPDKYGDDNSGILDSWTLVFYGTK